jgi:hypothetical protein
MNNVRSYAARSIDRRDGVSFRRLIIVSLITILVILCTCIFFGNILSSAHERRDAHPVEFKYYKSIVIQPEDTLWGIAETYITEDYSSITAYVNALKEINALKSDDIQAGQNLIIAYNTSDFIQ